MDEFVKFLFLTHNQNSRVSDALLDRIKATDTLAQCLAIAKTVESMMETEKLSKSFLENINKHEMSKVDSVHNQKKGFKGPGRKQSRSHQQCSHSDGNKNKCRNCGSNHPPKKCQAMERSASYARRRDISNNTVIVLHKTIHNIDQDEEVFQMKDYDSVNVQTVHFTTDVCHTAHTNIISDEISSDRKLQCLLTDDSPGIGVFSTVRIKLDTGACGNLLPFNIYKNIHPQVSVKDLCKTIDKRVCLEAYNKSEINSWVHVA